MVIYYHNHGIEQNYYIGEIMKPLAVTKRADFHKRKSYCHEKRHGGQKKGMAARKKSRAGRPFKHIQLNPYLRIRQRIVLCNGRRKIKLF